MRHTRKKKRSSRLGKKRPVYIGGQANSRCIFIEMLGAEGLGNQLFIFAAGLTVQQKTGLPLCVIPSDKNPHTKIDYRPLFKIPSKVSIVEKSNARPRLNAANLTLNLQNGHRTAKWSNANIKYNSASAKNVKIPPRLYQNYASIQKVIPVVKDALMTNEFNTKQVYRDLEKETPAGSAFIHVRRGDYAERKWALDKEYYLRGLDIIDKDPNITTIWIISNDLDWCKKVDWASHTKKTLKYYNSESELETLYKMMLCTAGAVLSPSTFGAWGAMMGADMTEKPTIVFPQGWLTHDRDPINAFMFPEPKWTKIPNSVAITTTLI